MKSIRYISLALLALTVAAPAAAETVRVPVSYSGLDLNSPAGIAELDARIGRAVDQICGRPFPDTLTSRYTLRRCQTEARSSVQAQRADALAQAQSRGIQMASRGE